MKKGIMTLLTLCLLTLSSLSLAQNSNYRNAQSIIENWFMAMKNQQLDMAASYLAPQFTSVHTDGLARNKRQELRLIKGLNMQGFHLTDFQFKQSGDVIIVTFKDQSVEKIDKQTINPKAALRLAVLQKQGNNWLIVAYANMDSIN